ncbi:MAG TPA: sialate O-acetylesterase, partial [Bacteroidales bacterium]|nr:sialate O-acetylesterase [Bacteroidales bacterium]
VVGLTLRMDAAVRLPHIISSNMVLQRNVKTPVWGWADKGEKIRITFAGKKYSTVANANGKWIVYMDALPEGGPYELVITASNKITLSNILIGEVWVCSGQSNMEWPVASVNNADTEIATANYPKIRLFTVPKKISGTPKDDIDNGQWQECSSATIPGFSAVGYFFGRNLHQNLNVPIGLINSSWGGTILETWASTEAVSTIPDFNNAMAELKKADLPALEANAEKLRKEWNDKINNGDKGVKENWSSATYSDASWRTMELPQTWEKAGLDIDGVVWFRKEIKLDAAEAAAGISLNLGAIDDSDNTFVNGNKVGETLDEYSKKRVYNIAPQYLKEGVNIIAVKVIDTGGGGGIWGDPADMFYTTTKGKISLVGTWKYEIGVNPGVNPSSQVGPNAYPTLLFNGMIHPILPYAVQGAIWYQGESNASRAKQYERIFPMLINDWRKQWNNSNLSFHFVQLANYMAVKPQPGDSEWAELRDAQLKTLSLDKTGMAVIIDIGEAKDIHPRNKQDVGYRLSLAARKVTYGQDIVYSGPTYKSFSKEGNRMVLQFSNTGSGMIAKDKYGYVKGFAIAGDDKKFVWAQATIEGDKVIVWSNDVKNPTAVRYAWADNPDDANLYNKEGLPASPFRTDNWEGITK